MRLREKNAKKSACNFRLVVKSHAICYDVLTTETEEMQWPLASGCKLRENAAA